MPPGEPAAILPLFETAIARRPADEWLRMDYARALLRQYRLREAHEVVVKALAIRGKHHDQVAALYYHVLRLRGDHPPVRSP